MERLRIRSVGTREESSKMTDRTVALRSSSRHSILLLGLLALTATPGVVSTGAAQVSASASGAWEVPRTSDGHPDLQGNWNNASLTPFEREEGRGALFTWEEVAELERGDGGCPPSPGTVECGREDNRGDASLSNEARLSGNEYNEVYWDRGSRVAIVQGEPRTSLITFPPNGRIPALSPEGLERRREYEQFLSQFEPYDHPEIRPLQERCVIYGSSRPSRLGPPMANIGGYNHNYTIVQNADHVLIMAEMIHDTRIIRLGEPRRLPEDVRPWFGDSWGHWEGNTLVVETTNINLQQRFNVHSEDLKVLERFTRVDEDTILYEFEVHDPRTYSEPWGGQIPMKRFDDLLYEYACHEGNYSLAGVLSGARYEEGLQAAGR